MEIDTGDTVLHRPTGENWVVAYVRGDSLAWCGWPEGEAALSDCELTHKAPPERRDALLREMAAMRGDDARGRYARHRLAPYDSTERPPCGTPAHGAGEACHPGGTTGASPTSSGGAPAPDSRTGVTAGEAADTGVSFKPSGSNHER